MLKLIEQPTCFPVPEGQDLVIKEYIGRVNTGTGAVSIARLKSGEGWSEPVQTPEFDEYTLVLAGELHVEDIASGQTTVVKANQAIIVPKGVNSVTAPPRPAVRITLPSVFRRLICSWPTEKRHKMRLTSHVGRLTIVVIFYVHSVGKILSM